MALKPVDFNIAKTKDHLWILFKYISIQYTQQQHEMNFSI